MTDSIHLRNIRLPLILHVGPDAWHRDHEPQPSIISVRLTYPSALVARAAETDTVSQTLNYGNLYREIEARARATHETDVCVLSAVIAERSFQLVRETLTTAKAESCIYQDWERVKEAEVWIHLPKALLRAEQGLKYRILFQGNCKVEHQFTIEGIRSYCIIGVNPHERREKQAVLVTLVFYFRESERECLKFVDLYQSLTQQVAEDVDSSSFQTVEALATSVARTVTKGFGIREATVRVEKPSAQPFVEYSGVEITRNADFFEDV